MFLRWKKNRAGFSEKQDRVTDRDYCGNCGKWLSPGARYCSYCGAARGAGNFRPEDNIPECVYGPPITIKYRCSKCGFTWDVSCLGSDKSSYCPQCGRQPIDVLESSSPWDDGFDADRDGEFRLLKPDD